MKLQLRDVISCHSSGYGKIIDAEIININPVKIVLYTKNCCYHVRRDSLSMIKIIGRIFEDVDLGI